jgi:copper(I)-binding protein
MIMTRVLFVVTVMTVVFATPVRAADVEITDAWARATAGAGTTGVAYLTVINHGPDNAIIGALAPVAERAGLHGHRMDGDVMRMRPVESIDLPSGAAVTFEPGGLHVMLMGLTTPLAEGAWFSLSLELANGDVATTTVMVGGVGAMSPPKHSGHGRHE